jgi:citrate lyase subunit beta / citryl-CoA lyase
VKPVTTALYVPGTRERVMLKAIASGAEAVILDLEDTVPVAAKAEARSLVAKTIDGAAGEPSRPAIWVRVNAAATEFLEDDLAAVVRPGLDAIFLPKVESVEEVERTAAVIERAEGARGIKPGAVEIVVQVETALGVYRCFDLARASPRVGATSVGSGRDGDLQRDLGCSWSIEGTELLYARSKVLLDTRAAGAHLVPLDGVYSDLSDEAGLIADSRLSARLGYLGRALIHPKQIAPVKEAYAVPAAEVLYYKKVVAEFEAALEKGAAAITVEGKLVDYAMYERARRVLERAGRDR